jgi:27-O-demethylrifamycin SV methyltransferase
MVHADDPVTHYDRINRAWQLVLGEDFHYGCYDSADEPLATATARLSALMADEARLEPGLELLDVGCGIGNPACLLAETHGCRVTGITTSRNGVELARRRAAARGCADRVSFVVADGMANGLPDRSFDRVWVMESSHLMPRKDRLLAECARVLRPGGRLVLCDVMLRRELPLAEVLSRPRDFVPLHEAFGRAKMETLDTYTRLLRDAGLEPERSIDLSERTFPTFAAWRHQLDVNAGAVEAEIGADGLAHLRASCDVLARLWNEPLLGYGMVVARKALG